MNNSSKYPQGVGRAVPAAWATTATLWQVAGSKIVSAATQYLFLAVCCLLFPVFSYAEELPDPTRPPASIAEPAVVVGVTANPPAGLQSIIIGKYRRAAIIDGQTVELGGKHNDAKLIEVNTANVVLRTAQGRQVLTLFPDVKINSKSDTADLPSSREKVRAGTHKPVRAMENK